MWQVEFESAEFLPYLPEHCQVNPGCYGFELAYWLSTVLAKQGDVTGYPEYEDWCWFIEYLQDEVEIRIVCYSQAELGQGYSGKPVTWSIVVEPRLSFIQRIKGIPSETSVQHLTAAITSALTAKGISVRQV